VIGFFNRAFGRSRHFYQYRPINRSIASFNELSRATEEQRVVGTPRARERSSSLACVLPVGYRSGEWIIILNLVDVVVPPRPRSAPKRRTRRWSTTGLPGLSLAPTRPSTPSMRAWAPSPRRSHLSPWWRVCRYAFYTSAVLVTADFPLSLRGPLFFFLSRHKTSPCV